MGIPDARLVPVAATQIYLRTRGEGAPVLLLHGAPSHSGLWDDVIPRLATRARVLAPDLPGYGRSPLPPGGPPDLHELARTLVELLDALGIDRVTLAGHDIGGGIAQVLATRYAARVERLALIDCVCYDAWPTPEMRALQLAAPVVARMPPAAVTGAMKLWLRRGFVHADRADRFLDAFLAPYATPEGLRRLVAAVRPLRSDPTRRAAPRLRELEIPVAVAWGRHDPFLRPRLAERLASDIPGAELTWIEASHYAPADHPSGVAAALERLLER